MKYVELRQLENLLQQFSKNKIKPLMLSLYKVAGFENKQHHKSIDLRILQKLVKGSQTDCFYLQSFGVKRRGKDQNAKVDLFQYHKKAQFQQQLEKMYMLGMNKSKAKSEQSQASDGEESIEISQGNSS